MDTEVVNNPGWAYGATVPLTGTVPVHIEIWDEDGESPLVPSLNFGDDLIDIDPDDSDDDSTLDLHVDMAKCISGEPGAITGDADGRLRTDPRDGQATTIRSVGASERAKVRFRIFMPNLPPVANAGPDRHDTGGHRHHARRVGLLRPRGQAAHLQLGPRRRRSLRRLLRRPTPDVHRASATTARPSVKLCVTDDAGPDRRGHRDGHGHQRRTGDRGRATRRRSPRTPRSTVAGTIRDPGWLDALTATIDWGDGSAVQTLTGTLENDRPDATLTFSTSHTYGDNGTFAVKVCGADDDTTPCKTVDGDGHQRESDGGHRHQPAR